MINKHFRFPFSFAFLSSRILSFMIVVLVAACTPPVTNYAVDPGRSTPMQLAQRPDFPGYGSAIGKQPIEWTPGSLAHDFAELMFETEWGAKRKTLLRWQGPVTIALADSELDAFRPEIETFVSLIRKTVPELDLSVTDTRSGTITLRTAPSEEITGLDPTALCFFVPLDDDLDGYVAATKRGEARWGDVERLDRITIFIPRFARPIVFRACIIEELAQALGPVNDLYRLEDSSFNDDGAHNFLTAFDFLMLRVLYAPELRAGMSRRDATAAAEQAIRRIGQGDFGTRTRSAQSRDRAYDKARKQHSVASNDTAKRQAIDYLLRVTSNMDPNDHRRGEALRLSANLHRQNNNLDLAVKEMRQAVALFDRTLPADSARRARARSDLGFFLTEAKDYEEAADSLKSSEAGLAANGIDGELALTLFQRAIALHLAGRVAEAKRVEQQALEWGAYVYGADGKILLHWRKVFKDLRNRS